ncbi:hypothetical protein ACOJUR_08245 [Alicyclobacillus tolerans]|uniref:hypothetical protein n=1 Tax=Alicyclobacillus tolerans TaxID=90970 RepID=UPI003B7CBE6E
MSKKFAFFIHPRSEVQKDMRRVHPLLGIVPDIVYQQVLKRIPVPPFVSGKLSTQDQRLQGELILIPFSAKQMLELPPKKVFSRIEKAVDLAKQRGCELVGLGALTAPLAGGGRLLQKRTDIGITNGNAFTAAMTLLATEKILNQTQKPAHLAIVGASGSTGQCFSELLAHQIKNGSIASVTLIARNEIRLAETENRILKHKPNFHVKLSRSMNDVKQSDVIILLTSSTENLLRSEHLKEGAIVLDDTQPRNTSPDLCKERPDVMILDGGLVETSGVFCSMDIGLPKGHAYACLAETELLALEGHQGHFSIGNPEVEQAKYMIFLAQKYASYGFRLAKFRSFGKRVDRFDSMVDMEANA